MDILRTKLSLCSHLLPEHVATTRSLSTTRSTLEHTIHTLEKEMIKLNIQKKEYRTKIGHSFGEKVVEMYNSLL